MGFKACFRVLAVRYVSVGTEFWGRKIHGRNGGSGYADRPPGLVSLTWHFRSLLVVVISLVARLGPGILYSEGVG